MSIDKVTAVERTIKNTVSGINYIIKYIGHRV